MTNRRDDTGHSAPRLRDTWPLGRREALTFAVAYMALVALLTGVGLLLKGPLDDSALVRLDRRVAQWFADQRTPNLNTYTMWGSDIADTVIKIVATAIIALVLLALWRRWLEPLMVVVSLVLEAAVFISVTWLVGRPRPDVERLEGSPVNSGFPSGHTAAAAAYAALAVVVFWHTRTRWIRLLAAGLTVAVTLVVAVARMYRGMHYLSDVLVGVLLGAASVAITAAVLSRAQRARQASRDADATHEAERRRLAGGQAA
jgi:undecaprenyl-diphosphatase